MNLRGVDAEIRRLQSLERDVKAAQRRGELRAAEEIAASAKSLARGNRGSLISVSQTEESTTINGGDEFSAYVEFGTGPFSEQYLAGKPAEIVEEARKFFVNGKGTMPASPSLFPAVEAGKGKILPYVEEELNKLGQRS